MIKRTQRNPNKRTASKKYFHPDICDQEGCFHDMTYDSQLDRQEHQIWHQSVKDKEREEKT